MRTEPRPVVLVAEDHPVNQKVMGLVLGMLGVDSEIVSNGRDAIEAAKPDGYALILMDIMMPEMDGFEAAYEIRKREFELQRHTPIVACTALDKDRVKEQCLRSGMDDYIAKPVSKEALQSKVERWSQIPIRPQPSAELEKQIEQFNGTVEEAAMEPIDKRMLRLLYGLEQLGDVMVLFMTVTETLLAQLESAIEHHDVAVVRRMAHEIKGSSYAVSAKEMSDLCLQLELAGESQNWNEAEKLYTALGLAFARVREYVTTKQERIKEQIKNTS